MFANDSLHRAPSFAVSDTLTQSYKSVTYHDRLSSARVSDRSLVVITARSTSVL